ncbi:MAG TPA: MFS transporter [Candidatus Acidoferrum sp.]|nr:MFS transporter [Candidatus Acidoferrum sp.]
MGDLPHAVARFLRKFTVLRGAARELWITFVAKLLVIAAYALCNSTLVLWLSSDFGFGDKQALATVAFWSLLLTAVTVVVGPLTDALGLRRTLFLGVGICAVSRAVMAFSSVQWLALAGGMFPLAIGEALSTPVLVAAVRRYSDTRQRSISFSLFYLMMNVGFFIAAFLFDGVRQGVGEHGHLVLPVVGVKLSAYRTLLLASLGLELMIFPVVYLLREGAEATDDGLRITPPPPRPAGEGWWASGWRVLRNSVAESIRVLSELFRQPGVYRLLVFLLLIAFIKLVLMQIYYVYPKFGIRELGDGAPVGRLWAINSILIIFLVPVIGGLTQKYPAYGMVTLGSILTAASVFIMAMPTAWFQPLANGLAGNWLGHGYLRLQGSVHPYYVMIALFVVLFSFGEAFYSPRVYEYAAAIAPKGLEASYSALSYVPFLLAKLLVGTFGGTLLATYCPQEGPRHSGTMWLIVALTATVAPIGLIALRGSIRVREAGRQE